MLLRIVGLGKNDAATSIVSPASGPWLRLQTWSSAQTVAVDATIIDFGGFRPQRQRPCVHPLTIDVTRPVVVTNGKRASAATIARAASLKAVLAAYTPSVQ